MCNQMIFKGLRLLDELVLYYNFSNIVATNNKIKTIGESFFFEILFNSLTYPHHSTKFLDSYFSNNTIIKWISPINPTELVKLVFNRLTKIRSVFVSNVTFLDHFDVGFYYIYRAFDFTFTHFNCSNTIEYK